MKNLAGVSTCDEDIRKELTRARIPIVPVDPTRCEVPYSIIGKIEGPMGQIEFKRAWYYWVADGRIPLNLAKSLYADPIGVTDIRVSGDCTCPAPEGHHVHYLGKDGRVLQSRKSEQEFIKMKEHFDWAKDVESKYEFVDDVTIGKPYIEGYHIDTMEGLRVFVDAILDYNAS